MPKRYNIQRNNCPSRPSVLSVLVVAWSAVHSASAPVYLRPLINYIKWQNNTVSATFFFLFTAAVLYANTTAISNHRSSNFHISHTSKWVKFPQQYIPHLINVCYKRSLPVAKSSSMRNVRPITGGFETHWANPCRKAGDYFFRSSLDCFKVPRSCLQGA